MLLFVKKMAMKLRYNVVIVAGYETMKCTALELTGRHQFESMEGTIRKCRYCAYQFNLQTLEWSVFKSEGALEVQNESIK